VAQLSPADVFPDMTEHGLHVVVVVIDDGAVQVENEPLITGIDENKSRRRKNILSVSRNSKAFVHCVQVWV
jgi:hypothetical protein